MFFISHIWKRLNLRRIIMLALSVAALALPAIAMAAGETYDFGTGKTSITASGGSLKQSTTLAQDAKDSNKYVGTDQIDCGGTDHPLNLVVELTPATASNDPAPGTTKDSSVPDLANTSQCATLDQNVQVSASAATSANGATTSGDDACADRQGSLAWIACPVIDNVSSVISNLARDVLPQFLRVKPISPTNTPGIFQVWQRVRDVADILFVVVFMVLIIGQAMQTGMSSYTIKSMLPRLIAAAIMVQFSFYIAAAIVDLGNVLGAGVDSFFTNVLQPTKQAGTGTGSLALNVVSNLGAGTLAAIVGAGAIASLAAWPAALTLLVTMLISLSAVFLTLGARYLIISILIAISPLAFVAWVLPNTKHFFKDWHEVLFRLVMMYPIVMGILSLAGIVNEVLSFGGDTADSTGARVAEGLVKPLVVIAAFLIIPKSFQYAGKALNRAYGLLQGAQKQGMGRWKNSQWHKDGQEVRQKRRTDYMGRLMNGPAVTRLGGGNKAQKALAKGWVSTQAFALGGGAPDNQLALARAQKGQFNADKKALGDLGSIADNPNNIRAALKVAAATKGTDEYRKAVADLNSKAPALMRYTQSEAGREALMDKLGDKVMDGDLTGLAEAGATTTFLGGRLSPTRSVSDQYAAYNGQAQVARVAKPAVVVRHTSAKTDVKFEDSAGNAIPMKNVVTGAYELVSERAKGAVDVQGMVGMLRGVRDLGDKFDVTNFEVTNARQDADVFKQQAAYDAAMGLANGLDVNVVQQGFSTTTRNRMNPNQKFEFYRTFKANQDVYLDTAAGQKQLNAAMSQLGSDDTLRERLATQAGVPSYVLPTMTSTQQYNVVKEWLEHRDPINGYKDRTFDYTKLSSGGYS